MSNAYCLDVSLIYGSTPGWNGFFSILILAYIALCICEDSMIFVFCFFIKIALTETQASINGSSKCYIFEKSLFPRLRSGHGVYLRPIGPWTLKCASPKPIVAHLPMNFYHRFGRMHWSPIPNPVMNFKLLVIVFLSKRHMEFCAIIFEVQFKGSVGRISTRWGDFFFFLELGIELESLYCWATSPIIFN